jgi:hypothetical protein
VEKIREAAVGLPASVAHAFREELRLDASYPSAPLAIYVATIQSLSSSQPSTRTSLLPPGVTGPTVPSVRTRSQVIGDMGALLFGLLVLAVVTSLTTFEIVAWLEQRGSPLPVALAWGAGLFVPAAAVGIGLLLHNVLARLRYATPAEQTLGGRRGRKLMTLAYGVTASLIGLLLAAISVSVSVLRAGLVVNALLGLLQAAVLLGLGGYLDAQIVAFAHASYLAWLGAIRILAVVGAALAHLLATLCVFIEYGVRLAAIPGDVIRSAFARHGRSDSTAHPAAQS